ncbi:5-hydroxyisourate hydrolase, partial [Acetobacter malorum]
FEIAAYFRTQGHELADPPFLDVVPLVFGLSAEGHAHVPLLAAPYGYSTYRGS